VKSTRKLSRRSLLLAGASLTVVGCAKQNGMLTSRPRPLWPTVIPAPQPPHTVSLPPVREPVYQHYSSDVASSHTYAPAPAPPPQQVPSNGVQFVPRHAWTRVSPIRARLNNMGGVNRITVHHEGWKAVWFDNWADTAERLRLIQKFHMGDSRGWGDIGYHYIIDRDGRIIEGRPLHFQGAHVKANNENNIGVMVLGNFDKQTPSLKQLSSVQIAVSQLMKRHRVPLGRVYTHQEINPTSCPGSNLQPTMVALRRNGHLG